MVSCTDCGGHLHRDCGFAEDGNGTHERRCSACVSKGNGKRRLETQCIEPGCTFEATIAMVCCTACRGDLHSTCGTAEYLSLIHI